MRAVRMLAIAASAAVLGACYHATIDTGLAPSNQVITEKWAAGWILGLIPPDTVHTASQCPSGVARVETRHSFLNMLVQGLTGGIFTPMTIEVRCAAGPRRASAEGGQMVRVQRDASAAERAAALRQAIERAEATGAPAYLQLE